MKWRELDWGVLDMKREYVSLVLVIPRFKCKNILFDPLAAGRFAGSCTAVPFDTRGHMEEACGGYIRWARIFHQTSPHPLFC